MSSDRIVGPFILHDIRTMNARKVSHYVGQISVLGVCHINDLIFTRDGSPSFFYGCSGRAECPISWYMDESSWFVRMASRKSWLSTSLLFSLGSVKRTSLINRAEKFGRSWEKNRWSHKFHPSRYSYEISWCGSWSTWEAGGECHVIFFYDWICIFSSHFH